MDVQILRLWGIGVGAALIALALWIAALGPEAAPARASAQARVETQQATAAPASFLVRFRGFGPIARAQAAAGRGEHALAQRRIEAQLLRQRAFSGLCFQHFTAGAAEVVLHTCDPVPAPERAAVEAQWLARLRAMRAVDYADVNAVATIERAD